MVDADPSKIDFLAALAHELRTPLNGMIGFSEFLLDGAPGPLNDKQKEYLGDVLAGSLQLLGLINDTFDLANLEGRTDLRFENLPAGPPWAFKAKGGGLAQASVQSRLRVNSAEAAVDAAIAGVGVAHVLSYQAAAAIRSGELTLLLRSFEPEALPVHLVHDGQGALPVKTRRFLDFAVPQLRERLGAPLRG